MYIYIYNGDFNKVRRSSFNLTLMSFIETILLQLNSSNNYYTSGDDDILFIKIGSNKVLVLDYTYHINRNIFQNYTINENSLNNYDLEFILNNTSNEYDLQSVYNGNGFLGIIT